MFRSLQRFLVAAAIGWSVTAGSFVQSADRAATYDVVIYGGTSAGIAAAVQTVRQGKTVVVIEPSGHLGGLTTSGLGWTDTGNKAAIGGIAREFYQAVKRHYDQPSAWKYESADDYDRYRPADDAMWTFEPHVAAAIFERWLADAKVPVVLNQRLDRGDGITIHDGRIQSIRTESGQTFRGLMFIDATYEGDLMALAGVTYTVGRESNIKYNEQLNGVQKDQNVHNHRFLKPVDPYVRPGDSTSGVLPGIQTDGPGEDGAGDHRVQAYCYRMCMSNVPENRVPFEKPDGYDQQRYELLLRNFEAGDLRVPLSPGMLP
ncbi:MAG: FAD-dependent oxidoreductase, partial [Planctomycetales bacterium]|nr:FAD-dependent oxidoreductase [Planctomycetales bacterium]